MRIYTFDHLLGYMGANVAFVIFVLAVVIRLVGLIPRLVVVQWGRVRVSHASLRASSAGTRARRPVAPVDLAIFHVFLQVILQLK